MKDRRKFSPSQKPPGFSPKDEYKLLSAREGALTFRPRGSTKNVAVVGAGYWGKNLVRVFNALGALKLVCDCDEKVIKDMRKNYHLKTTADFDRVLGDKQIKAVAISVPAAKHYELACKALKAGKHVFVEKPLALNYQEGQMLVELAEARKLTLMVGHLLNYHPAVAKLKTLIKEGQLGKLYYIYSTRLNTGKVRREENILWSFAPHDISVILSITQAMPISVLARGGNYLHRDIADVTMSVLDFPGGLKSHIFVSWLHPYKEQKLVLVGDKKMAVFNATGEDKEKLLIYPHQINWENNIAVLDRREPVRVEFETEEPLRLECKHFLSCVEEGRAPFTDGQEGLKVLKVLEACQESLARGGETIYLNRNSGKISEDVFIHPSSYIDDNVWVGTGTKIWHFSHILKGSKLGEGCRIGQNVVIGPDVVIGKNVKIQNNVCVYKGVTLEDGVFCGPSVVFTNVFNPRSEIPRMEKLLATRIKKGATLGANSTVVCGCSIGKYAFIGAGAVVTKDVPDYALVYGNPAKLEGWVCECADKLEFKKQKSSCGSCGKQYKITLPKAGKVSVSRAE